MQEESGDFDDVLCEIVENDGGKRRVSVRFDPSLSCQPRADHSHETQRECQYPHDRAVLQNPILPCGGRHGVRGGGIARRPALRRGRDPSTPLRSAQDDTRDEGRETETGGADSGAGFPLRFLFLVIPGGACYTLPASKSDRDVRAAVLNRGIWVKIPGGAATVKRKTVIARAARPAAIRFPEVRKPARTVNY